MWERKGFVVIWWDGDADAPEEEEEEEELEELGDNTEWCCRTQESWGSTRMSWESRGFEKWTRHIWHPTGPGPGPFGGITAEKTKLKDGIIMENAV
jgi:hypothetical protein